MQAEDPARASREQADVERQQDGMELSQDERDQMLRDDAMQNQLPTPPKRAGVHWFWASLENRFTPITWYMRLGYRVVKFEELAGWADANMRAKSGDHAGCISVNEMILMQCSEADYQRYMKIAHHEKPNSEQRAARGIIDTAKNSVEEDSSGRTLVTEVGKGFQEMDRQVVQRSPKFD